mmetsp:Transcript_1467/g.3633  ORF Transcript_1467/g.3633 Transcript_1467/m.3633 type:complete len:226 (+) Transcript_1467:475-1152(+)
MEVEENAPAESNAPAGAPAAERIEEEDVDRVEMQDVHGLLSRAVWHALAEANFMCIMSPGEADHQIGYMNETGDADGAATVDSDLAMWCLLMFMSIVWSTGLAYVMRIAGLFNPLAPDPDDGGAQVDLLDWLQPHRNNPELQKVAKVLMFCTAHSDFNQIPGIGEVSARRLVLDAAPDLHEGMCTKLAVFRRYLEDVHAPEVYAAHVAYAARRPSASTQSMQQHR